MANITLRHKELLELVDKDNNRTWGADQLWFPKKGYVPPGACGATTASNIMGYLVKSRKDFTDKDLNKDNCLSTKEGFLEFMKMAYPFLCPGVVGLMADNFMNGICRFSESLGTRISAEQLKVPITRSLRPSVEDTVSFIAESIKDDIPVGFIILSSGATPEFDGWHWITIIGIDEENRTLDCIDNGEYVTGSVERWLKTTIMGGGFIKIRILDRKA